MKFTVSFKVELRTDVNIEADSLKEAMTKATYDYIEIQDLNLSEMVDMEPVNISDENGNLLADF